MSFVTTLVLSEAYRFFCLSHLSQFVDLTLTFMYSSYYLVIFSNCLPLEKDSSASIPPLFAFEAQSWSRCIDHMAELRKVFRQKDASELLQLIQGIILIALYRIY